MLENISTFTEIWLYEEACLSQLFSYGRMVFALISYVGQGQKNELMVSLFF